MNTAEINQKLQVLDEKIQNFFNFIGTKLKNFKYLTLGEQISYGIIGGGFVFLLLSIVFFII